MRCRSLIALMLLFTSPVVAAPPEWTPADVVAGPSTWWGVEVGRYPSRLIASSVRTTLENYGWGPVAVSEEGGQFVLVAGEAETAGAALYLLAELKAQELSDGRVVRVPRPVDRAVAAGIAGQFTPPFVPTPGKAPAQVPTPEAIKEHLSTATVDTDAGDDADAAAEAAASTRQFLRLWNEEKFEDEDFAAGALAAIEHLYQQGTQPEMVLWLAGRLARQQWPAAPAQRMRAQEIVADVLYGNRRDWRGAWASTNALRNHPDRSPAAQAADMLRQAALVAEAVDRGELPGRDFALVRARLRTASDTAPEGDAIHAAIEAVYIQTFAWEGNWRRVEELARAYLTRHGEARPHADLARIALAQSLERHQAWEEAIQVLDEVISQELPREQWLRMGTVLANPVERARAERQRLRNASATQ